MPSLRRTLSSPSVRSSPYSYSSSSNIIGHATRAGNPQPRRSSGSDAHNRRVLADIDWWTVQDGQRDLALSFGEDASNDSGATENEQVRPLGANIVPDDLAAVPSLPLQDLPTAVQATGAFESEVLSSALWDVSTDSPFVSGSPEVIPSPPSHFAALSLGPRMPLHRHTSNSSESSFDSTLDSAPGSPFMPTYMDLLQPAAPAYPSAFASHITSRRPAGRAPLIPTRSVSYSAVEFQLSTTRLHDDRFDDFVPSPPPFFSSTMDDDMDLFY